MTGRKRRQRLGRSFNTFLASMVASDFGEGVYLVAVPLLALRITRSPVLISGVGLAVRLPWLLVTLPAGVLTDRRVPLAVMRAFSLLRLPLMAVLVALTFTNHLSVLVLALTAFAVEAANNCVAVAGQAALSGLVAPEDITEANGSLQGIQLLFAQCLGPAVAGLVISRSPATGILMSGCLYCAALFFLMLLARHGRGRTQLERRVAAESMTYRLMARDLKDGLAYFRSRPDLVRLAGTAAANNMSYALAFTMLPLWVVRPGRLGLTAFGYGVLLSVVAVGGFVGSRVAKKLSPEQLQMMTKLGPPFLGVCYALLTIPVALVDGAALFVCGFVAIMWNVVVVSHRQLTIPTHLFARVNAAYRWITWGTLPLGAFLAGVIARVANIRLDFIVAAILPVAVAVLFPTRMSQIRQRAQLAPALEQGDVAT